MFFSQFLLAVLAAAMLAVATPAPARADETCNPPYLSTLIHGQEDYLYVWTLGVAGLGDGFDKLVTLAVKPGSANYGKVIAQASVGDIRKYDVPLDHGGDGYGYDIAINPARNAMLTSSFTGRRNYMTELGTLIKDPAAMAKFGNTMVVWNLKAMQPEQVLKVPGAPLEIRWSLREGDDWAITSTALTSRLGLVKKDGGGAWQAKAVADIGDPPKTPLPVDMSISADSKGLWVNTFMDGTTRYFDISNPEAPKQTYAKKTGSQVNMISQSWDGRRVYISCSLLAKWDKTGKEDEQFVKLYSWDGKGLKELFKVDFYPLKLGRAHHMKLGARRADSLM